MKGLSCKRQSFFYLLGDSLLVVILKIMYQKKANSFILNRMQRMNYVLFKIR
jgi:hypothetical protein